MPLERQQTQNYQKHQLHRLKFDQKVTTLVGHSNAGKSSILRALRWVCLNRPLGTEAIRHGSKWADVSLWCDGHRIVRRLGDRNTYSLDGKVYKAIGAGIPEAIAHLLNVDEINFQTQLASAFWFHDSGGQVSKNLNTIINLDLIDSTLAALASEQRQIKAEIQVSESRLAEAEKDVEELEYVDKLDKDWQEVCRLEEDHAQIQSKIDQIESAVESLSESISVSKLAGAAISEGEHVVSLLTEADQAQKTYEHLAELLASINQTTYDLAEIEYDLEKTKAELGDRCPTCGKEI